MGRASPRANAPAGGGRTGAGRARIGHEQARGQAAGGGEGQASRRRELGLLHHADDEREARRLQAFLHGPQRFRRALCFHEQEG